MTFPVLQSNNLSLFSEIKSNSTFLIFIFMDKLAQISKAIMNWIYFALVFLFKKLFRSSQTEVFLRKGVLKICSKFTGEHPCQSVISIKLQSNFIEITLRHGCSTVNLLHTFRTPFPRNTYGWLLLNYC